MNEVTRILDRVQQGDARAAEELLPLVYEELRRLAAAKMAHERRGHTLQATALVHEAWLRLVGSENVDWNGRTHFFGAAAEAMRRILIENARRKSARRHGGGLARLDIDDLEVSAPAEAEDVLLLADALEKFCVHDHAKAELVKLRYFTGLTLEETAELLDISLATAKRWWTFSRAWLYEEMRSQRDCQRD